MVAFDLRSFKSLWIGVCMTKDEALKQAREALLASPTSYRAPKTIAAIEEALAQPEQLISDQINYGMSVTQGGKRIDPMSIYKEPEHDKTDVRCECCGYMTYHREHLGCIRAAKLKEPEQEPVAWRYKILDYFGRPVWTFKTPKTDIRVFESQPLYTSPPQRKPLTDEEIGSCIDEVNLTSQYGHHHFGWHKQFARAIEAAHGIKELA